MKILTYILLYIFTLSMSAQTFSDISAPIVPVTFGASDWGDYDNDGYEDLIVTGSDGTNSSITKLYKNNAGAFTEVTGMGFPNITLGSVEWGDFNNDTFLDLLMLGYIEGVEEAVTKLFKNNGDGTFIEIANSFPQTYQGDISWVDYNNDNYLDFSITGFYDENSTYVSEIYTNNQDETFSELTTINLPGTLYGKIEWADYNNDTYQDFVFTGFTTSGMISEIWYNNGDETFTESGNTIQQVWLGDVEWGDYDNDTYVDLFLTGDNTGIKYSILYHNNGDGTFTDSGEVFSGVSHSSVEWADFDNDGYLDIFLAGTGDAMGTGNYSGTIYKNNAGSFSEAFNFPGTYWGDCKVADFNNDSFTDIFINGYDVNESFYSAIFENDGDLSIEENEIGLIVAPNPTSNFVTISTNAIMLKNVIISDLTGKEIFREKMNNYYIDLDISFLSKGVYFLSITTDSGLSTKKLIKE